MPDDASALRARIADAILDAAADAVIAADRNGTICFWSPGATRIFGFKAAEAVGKSLDIIIPERLQARHWDGFHAVMSSGRSRYPEGHLLSAPGRRKDGTPISVEFTVAMLKDESGQITNIVAIMRDVTERFEETKALRRQLRGNAAS